MPRTPWIIGLLAALSLTLMGCAATNASGTVETIDASAAAELLAEHDDVTIIDVRTPGEYASGHLADAVLIDIQAPDFEQRIAELDRDGAYVVYCRTGNRSAQAAARMDELGFTEVYDAGGFADLEAAGAATG
jgi:phage shock protein E